MTSVGPKQKALSVTRAWGWYTVMTVVSPEMMGPPRCGAGPDVTGHTWMSVMRDALGIVYPPTLSIPRRGGIRPSRRRARSNRRAGPGGGPPALAADQEILELTRAVIQVDRREIVASTLNLTPDEAEIFWPLYQTYSEEIGLVKEREAKGYAYESAGASFELLARRTLGSVPDYFKILGFRVGVEQQRLGLLADILRHGIHSNSLL